jgi:hypothetical protein
MNQLERDIRACVKFLAEDPWRTFRALHEHTPGPDGLCTAHASSWPCTTYWLATLAEQQVHARADATMPIPRISGERDDQAR